MLSTRNLTILFTDIVGYTERTALQSRAEQVALLQQHDRLLQPLIRQFGGTLVKSMGDGLLVTFRSSTMGLRCAMAMQDALAAFNREQPAPQQLHIRCALASGDVQLQEHDVFGEAVSIASRIETMTPPDEIFFAASVYLAMNKAEISAELVASHHLKGIPFPVEVYRVLPQGEDGRYHPAGEPMGVHDIEPGAAAAHRPPLGRRVWLLAGLLAVVVGLLLWLQPRPWLVSPPPAIEATPPAGPIDDASGTPPVTAAEEAPEARLESIETLLERDELDRAQQVLREVLAASEASAAILLAQGHLAFATQHRETGADTYRKALELDPGLAENPRLAANLVSALGWKTRLARELLERYRSAAMVEALAARTAEPGYWGRLHAAQVLEAIGQGDRIQRLEAALLDLREGEDCQQRKAAVQRLGELGDRRALPALQPLAEMSLLKRVTSPDACLVAEARAAVDRISGDAKPAR